MKAFIVAALLVACVAGQSLDMHKFLNKDLSITSRKGMTYNQRYPYSYYPYGMDYSKYEGEYNMPSTHYYGGDDDMYNVLSYEEIMSHPMFREYMSIPLFRQYWSYPSFQRFVGSVYFQRFWQLPAYKQYFVNKYLFYTYIYPIVQLYDATTMNTYTGGDWIWNKNTYPVGGDYYHQGQEQQYYNHGRIPTVCYTNTMYCRDLVQKLYSHLMYTTKMIPETYSMDYKTTDDVYNKYNPYYYRMMYPNMYNKQFYPTVYNKEFNNFEIPSRTVINEETVRPFHYNTINEETVRPFHYNMLNKAMIGEKIREDKFPEQIIKV